MPVRLIPYVGKWRRHVLVNMVKGLGSSRQLPSSGALGFFRLEHMFTLIFLTVNCDSSFPLFARYRHLYHHGSDFKCIAEGLKHGSWVHFCQRL